CAPKFLDNAMTLGEVMQAASAFTIVQSALNWLVDNYPRLADWAASARRVASLELALDGLERSEIRHSGRIARGGGEDAALRLRDVSVTLDDGTAVVEGADVALRPGEKVLLTGDSGAGKSILPRPLAGRLPARGGPWQACGRGVEATLRSQPGGSYWFCRSGHMCRWVRFEGP